MVLGNKLIEVTSMYLHPSFSHISATLIEKSPLKLFRLQVAGLPKTLSPLLDAGDGSHSVIIPEEIPRGDRILRAYLRRTILHGGLFRPIAFCQVGWRYLHSLANTSHYRHAGRSP